MAGGVVTALLTRTKIRSMKKYLRYFLLLVHLSIVSVISTELIKLARKDINILWVLGIAVLVAFLFITVLYHGFYIIIKE